VWVQFKGALEVRFSGPVLLDPVQAHAIT
jgi:hypothetical protein